MEKKSYTFDEIKQKLANYCAYQDRCHYEVERKMKEFVLIPEAKDEIMIFLMKEDFLNEERYTRSYIRGKFYIKNWGRNKIKIHLKQKDISEKLINNCFDEIDENDYRQAIKKLYQSYYEKQKGLKDFQKRIKTTRYLLGKGYEYELIREEIED